MTSLTVLSKSFVSRVERASPRKFSVIISQRALCAIALFPVIQVVSDLKGSHARVAGFSSPGDARAEWALEKCDCLQSRI